MLYRNTIGAISLALVLCAPLASAFAFDDSKYPDFNGQWTRPPGVGNQFDISKPKDRGQQVPLTPEFQAVFEAGLADQAAGGQGNDPTYTCIPDGMPRVMNVIFPMEVIVTPNTTYMLIEYLTQQRSDLHRRARLSEGFRAELHRLLDRQMGRSGCGWPLSGARGRDPPAQGTAHLRPQRCAAPSRQ